MTPRFYHVNRPEPGFRQVEAWSGYPLQFAGQRRFRWQEQMAADLHAALEELAVMPGETLAGARCAPKKRPSSRASPTATCPATAGGR